MNRLFVLFSSLLILCGCASLSNKFADGVKPTVAAQVKRWLVKLNGSL